MSGDTNMVVSVDKSTGWHAGLRTVVLFVILGVLTWVGTSISKLNDSSTVQNISSAKLQTKFEDLETSIRPLADAVPKLGRDIDKLDLQSSDHERRISDLEHQRSMSR